MNSKHFIIGIIVAFFFCSCGDGKVDDVTIQMDRETFESEKASWIGEDLKNYQFTYEYSKGSTAPVGPVKIIIREDEEPIIVNQNLYNDYIVAENISEIYNLITDDFDYMESIKNGTNHVSNIRSVTMDITYNNQYHYPIKVSMSTEYNGEPIDGGGFTNLKIIGFVILD